jgi:hypothetical protein
MTVSPRSILLSTGIRYAAGALLAAAAQGPRLALHPPTLIPFITYVPFVVLSVYLGFGPGLLTTALCVLECLYFATGPVASFTLTHRRDWLGLALLALTGIAANVQFEWLRRSKEALHEALLASEA